MNSIYKKIFTALAIWVGCFILFGFVYMLVLVPQQKDRKWIEKRLAGKKQMYEAVLKTAQEETRIKLSEEIEGLRDSLDDFVIDFEDSANLIFDISQIADEKELDSFTIAGRGRDVGSEIPNCDYIYENHIDISFSAGFNQFATFLNALERHQPVIFVDTFTITRSEEENRGHKVNMDLTVFVKKREES
jgi:Tfp pilus assembly protein PilO